MKYRSTANVSQYLHLFLYGAQGSGKTKVALDFHESGQDVVIVTTEEQGDLPFETRGYSAPVLYPENYDELVAIITAPELVITKVIHERMGMPEYTPRTFLFDGIRGLQRMIFGELKKEETKVFDGAITLPARGSGILALPANRAPGIPSNQDYRKLDLDMRNIVGAIEKMPYHTIITAHAERDFSIETRMKLTGDAQTDKNVAREFALYPGLEGFSLKYDLPGLCSSFYLLLEAKQNQYTFKAHAGHDYHARTRIAEVMPTTPVSWTNQNMYELLTRKIAEAKEKLGK